VGDRDATPIWQIHFKVRRLRFEWETTILINQGLHSLPCCTCNVIQLAKWP
jgi:hypothetical protein